MIKITLGFTLQLYLIFFIFCNVATTNVNIFYYDFIWYPNTKWEITSTNESPRSVVHMNSDQFYPDTLK